jgi:hypothetical protein
MKKLDVLAVIHLGKYERRNGASVIVDDKCPCCDWDPRHTPKGKAWRGQPNERKHDDDPEWHLGEIWAPGVERGCGAYFQVFHCQNCGLVYATHLN